MTLHSPITADDDFLFDEGLPCLRKEGKLYYLGDVQPRVLEACRQFGIGFEQLADKLGMMRPALVLILKGYDPVPLPLKSMLDRLISQAESEAAPAPAVADPSADAPAGPTTTTILSTPVPEEALVTLEAETVVIPDAVALDRPARPLPGPARH